MKTITSAMLQIPKCQDANVHDGRLTQCLKTSLSLSEKRRGMEEYRSAVADYLREPNPVTTLSQPEGEMSVNVCALTCLANGDDLSRPFFSYQVHK